MKIPCLVFTILFLVISLGTSAQGAYLEKGQNGIGGEFCAIWDQEGFEAMGVTAAYSIAGILDIGAGINYTPGEIEGFSSSDLRMAFEYRVNVLKQSRGVPLSLQIMGSYGLNDVTSEYLDNNDATRRGTGFTIGLNLSRKTRLARFLYLHLNLVVDYESISYTTIGASPAVPDNVRDLYWGGGGGFLFVFPKDQVLAIRAELRADEDLELHIHPILGVAFPER